MELGINEQSDEMTCFFVCFTQTCTHSFSHSANKIAATKPLDVARGIKRQNQRYYIEIAKVALKQNSSH